MDTGQESAPVADSAQAGPPPSTQDIAATVIADAEQAERESQPEHDASPEPHTEAEPAKPKAPAVVKELTVEEQLLEEFGFRDARRPDGSEHRIARSKVLQMIGSGLKRGQARWEGERTALETQHKATKADLDEFIAAIRGDPRQFLETLAQNDARYTSFLTPAEAARQEPPPEADPEPQLDGTVESLNKLRAWDRRQAKREAEALVKPLLERDKAAQARAVEEKRTDAIRESSRTQMTEAQAWPMFGALPADGTLTEFQGEVLKVLQEETAQAEAAGRGPRMSLRQAYLEVHAKRLAALAAEDDAAKRARIHTEMNSAPRSTSVTRHGTEHTQKPGPLSTAEIARRTIAALEK